MFDLDDLVPDRNGFYTVEVSICLDDLLSRVDNRDVFAGDVLFEKAFGYDGSPSQAEYVVKSVKDDNELVMELTFSGMGL